MTEMLWDWQSKHPAAAIDHHLDEAVVAICDCKNSGRNKGSNGHTPGDRTKICRSLTYFSISGNYLFPSLTHVAQATHINNLLSSSQQPFLQNIV
ncbi:hypothetical protein CPSG_06012 [Coccidioides posadasii str. Silveira]|uniref:Uncharacterized protein n=1 Tax=Coccidioides posadasii (strain RMSCC 757 / Silveira) TaxID=443226 RepID=E9D860_COCPS|nr:hypothetical protein CPSG_06012 [Coccidioides posadasii str. Silveira]